MGRAPLKFSLAWRRYSIDFISFTVKWIWSYSPLETHTICCNVKKFTRSVCQKMSRHGGSNILGVFHRLARTQLNAARAQLIEKLRLEILVSFYGKFADF